MVGDRPPDGAVLLTPEQTAYILQVHVDTLPKLEADGDIPEAVISRRRCKRWHIEHIRAWKLGSRTHR